MAVCKPYCTRSCLRGLKQCVFVVCRKKITQKLHNWKEGPCDLVLRKLNYSYQKILALKNAEGTWPCSICIKGKESFYHLKKVHRTVGHSNPYRCESGFYIIKEWPLKKSVNLGECNPCNDLYNEPCNDNQSPLKADVDS